MKTYKISACCLALLLVTVFILTMSAQAQTAAFTYQGRLTDGANQSPTATYDIKFDLYDMDVDGTLIGSVTNTAVFVNSGVFTTTLNFGAAAFDGSARYLEISIRPAGSPATRTVLQPRQRITSTPYATQSNKATTAKDFSGSLTGDVTGTQTATVVSTVGGETAASVASGAQIANAATGANTPNAVVRRDANGNFAVSTVNAGNVVLATGGKVTFADGTQQATSVDPSLFVVRNQQSGSVLVEDTRLFVTKPAGNVEALLVTSPADVGNLEGLIARFRSSAGGSTPGPLADRFRFDQAGGFVARSTLGIGKIPASGCGERMMWHPYKGAFRAGSTNDGGSCGFWDETNVGFYSWAGGNRTIAKGNAAFAFGETLNVTANYGAAFGSDSTVSGQYGFSAGDDNRCSGDFCVSMGYATRATDVSSVALGYRASSVGDYSVALGYRARTGCETGDDGCTTPFARTGSFIFSDNSSTNYFDATANNQFNARAAGGYRLFTSADTTTVAARGVTLSANGGAWSTISDRNAKENFGAVNSREILRNVLKLPISTWNYKGQSYRHIGAMAQDFYKAFGVGESDKTITTVDPDGVAFAAIQGLNEEMQISNRKLQDENARLRLELKAQSERIAAIEARFDDAGKRKTRAGKKRSVSAKRK